MADSIFSQCCNWSQYSVTSHVVLKVIYFISGVFAAIAENWFLGGF